MRERKRGQPPHEPTEKDRRSVEMLVAAGVTEDDIGAAIGITARTLRKYYRKEIDQGRPKLILAAVGQLFNIMTKSTDERNRLVASIFVLKTRGRWSSAAVDDNLPPLPLPWNAE